MCASNDAGQVLHIVWGLTCTPPPVKRRACSDPFSRYTHPASTHGSASRHVPGTGVVWVRADPLRRADLK